MSNTLTLSQFQQLLGNTIRMNRDLQNVWVQAELSDVRFSGGHCYMELIEKDAAGGTRAKLRANIWSSILMLLRRKFFEATGRDIASGMKVLVNGSATHHVIYGLSFNITDIDPSYTLGDMERQRREIIEKLTREGVIDCNKRVPVPIAPQRIAVVSAAGAAGYGDFMNQIEGNPDGFAIYTMLFGAVMQGERTAESVMYALDQVEMTRQFWDAVVIIRGGGATTDLNGFDNYDLARRVATFPLPVIVGIGHERDRTVLDEIACVRCKTPTAVAAYIIDALRMAYALATDRIRHIADYVASAMKGEQMRLTNMSQMIPIRVNKRVASQRLALTETAGRIRSALNNAVRSEESHLRQLALKIETSTAAVSQREQHRLQRYDDMLRLLSPENTLKRGYSITRVDGKAVSDISEVPADAVIETTLLNGTILSKRVKEKKQKSK